MPRSGGEYVYNSRIIHPVFGIAQSFGDAAIWLMWLYVLAPLAVDPGLTITFNYLGWTGAANWLASATWHTFLIATLLQHHRLSVRGLRHQDLRPGAEDRHVLRHRRLRRSSAWCSPSRRGPRSCRKWNAAAAAPGVHGPTYHGFIAQVGAGRRPGHAHAHQLERHVRHHGRHVVAVRLRLLDRLHRRRGQAPRQVDHLGQHLRHPRAVRVHDVDRHRALPHGRLPVPERHGLERQQRQHARLDGRHAATAPTSSTWPCTVIGHGGLVHEDRSPAIMGFSYVAFTVWWLALSYLAFPRILFAWGMDRMGPKWFTDINPRFARRSRTTSSASSWARGCSSSTTRCCRTRCRTSCSPACR